MVIHVQKFKVNGQLVLKIYSLEADGRTEAIALPPSLIQSVLMC